MKIMKIVTHTSPDFDAIGAAWLLQRFSAPSEIRFLAASTPAEQIPPGAIVVDMGGGPYDHHQLSNPHETCGAKLVYHALWATGELSEDEISSLWPLVDLIWRGDTGRLTTAEREDGIHAALSAFKANSHDDAAIYGFGAALLDAVLAGAAYDAERGAWSIAGAVQTVLARPEYAGLIAERKARQAAAAAELEQHIVYRSGDGMLVAVDGGDRGSTQAAFATGAAVVVFHSPLDGTVAVGAQRNPEFDGVHLGRLVEHALAEKAAVAAELRTWYRHNAGFYAGRGTPKAPDSRPLTVPLRDLAAHLDAAWER